MSSVNSKTALSDPLKVANDSYKMVMENERVRVLDFLLKPGQKVLMHGHPDHIVCVLSDYRIKLMHPDGSSKEGAVKAGQVIWMHAGPHASENIGDTDAHALVIELKAT